MIDNPIDILILDDNQKERLTTLTKGLMSNMIAQTENNMSECAFVLKILIESFEKTQDCIVPFKGRYNKI